MYIYDYILSDKEAFLLKLIARTGFYIEAFNNKYKLSKSTLYSCIKKGLIYKEQGILVFTKLFTPYLLTDKGIELVKNRYLISPYRSKMSQSNHDYVLGNIYLSLTEEEQESWITETQLLKMYQNQNVVDAIYYDNSNNMVGVEVITKNYDKNKINSKMKFIDKYCYKSIVIDLEKMKL